MNSAELKAVLAMLDIEPPLLARLNAVIDGEGREGEENDRARALLQRATADARIGLAGGWVSFAAFSKTLTNYDMPVTPNRAHEILLALGYIRHPGLPNGRTNNRVKPEGVKARLYIQPDHPSAGLTRVCDIERAYSRAQGYGR